MKRGVVLLITIGLIMLLMPFVVLNLDIASKSVENIQKNKMQLTTALFLQDIIKTLDEQSKKIENSEDLEKLFTIIPPFETKDPNLLVSVVIEPLFDRVNINNLFMNNKVDQNIERYILNILDKYAITNKDFFVNLLLDTIDEDLNERYPFSEIKLAKADFRNGSIVSRAHLEDILDFFVKNTSDEAIKSIPWSDFFYFGEKDIRYMIDCDRVEKIRGELLGLKYNVDDTCEALNENENQAIAKNLNIQKFSKEANYFINCNVFFENEDLVNKYNIIYNIKYSRPYELRAIR